MKRITILTGFVLASILAFSQTHITSSFRNDTTLTASGNPYYISGYINVPDSVTLTIDPGVEIFLGEPGYFRVYGTLIAKGQPGNMILLEDSIPLQARPNNQIYVFGEMQLEYARVQNTEGVLIGIGGPQDTSQALVKHCEFYSCWRGVSGYRPGIRVDSCTFTQCTEGVHLEGNPYITNSHFIRNSSGAIVKGGITSNCTFVENFNGFISVGPNAHTKVHDCRFEHNHTGAHISAYRIAGRMDTFTFRNNFFTLDSSINQTGRTAILIEDVDDSLLTFKDNVLCSDFDLVRIADKPVLDLSDNCYCGLDSTQIAAKVQWINTSAPVNPYIFAPFYSDCGLDDVYPGDTDHDRIADMRDLLPIGIHFNQNGPTRPGATINWTGQVAPDWNFQQANGYDLKHVDSNGDGTIDANDTLAIIQNFGLVHRSYKNGGSGPPLVLQERNSGTIPVGGDTVIMDLIWGNMDTTVQDVYGLINTIYYDTSQIDEVKVEFPSSWFGTPASDLLTLGRHDPVSGRIDLGMVRTDGANASGFGHISSIIVVIDDDISKRQVPLNMSFGDVYAVNVDAEALDMSVRTEPILLSTTAIYSSQLAEEISVFPNPIQEGDMTLQLPNNHEGGELQVFDLNGRMVIQQSLQPAQQTTHFPMGDHANGMYLLRLQLGERVATLKVVKR